MNILLNVEKRHENSIWERSGYYLQKISNFYKTIKKCNFSKKTYILARCTRWKKRLRIVHLPHRNHKNSNWARSGFHFKKLAKLKKKQSNHN